MIGKRNAQIVMSKDYKEEKNWNKKSLTEKMRKS